MCFINTFDSDFDFDMCLDRQKEVGETLGVPGENRWCLMSPSRLTLQTYLTLRTLLPSQNR